MSVSGTLKFNLNVYKPFTITVVSDFKKSDFEINTTLKYMSHLKC